MSSELKAPSPLLRFVDSFLQEKNIKWLLGVGTLIVLGSSLRLVATHWEGYAPVWKYLVCLLYTGAIFAAGELCYWRLALRKTGTVLMGLTVLLLPITFFLLHWIRPSGDDSWSYFAAHTGLTALVGLNLAFTALAARKIFSHFLRTSQPTFLASYLMLCVAGAIVPGLPPAWCPWIALVLWAVLTAGVVKVNRHVFWLVEEHRLPRVCGFFPIGLLAAQYIAIAGLYLARWIPEYLSLDWLGLATVLAAVPVLLTADAVARVFSQRTGHLVRPLPLAIGAPLGVGLLLTVVGVCLAATGLPHPYALTPTALLAAGLLAVVARRTEQTAVVWLALAATVVAYNFSPVFFLDFARSTIEHGAVAVRESKLPYAFYGLTYLPLLLALTIGAWLAERRGNLLFARPLGDCAICLATLLLAAACGHPKALLPVGLTMIGMFALQTVLLAERRLILPAIGASIVAALGWAPFARDVMQWHVTDETPFLALAVLGTLLLVPGCWVDRWSRSLSGSSGDDKRAGLVHQWCQAASLLVSIATCAYLLVWLVLAGSTTVPYLAATMLIALLATHTLVWLLPGLGELTLVVAGLFAWLWMVLKACSGDQIFEVFAIAGLALWIVSYLLAARPKWRIARAFGQPTYQVSLGGLAPLAACYFGLRLVGASLFDPQSFPWLLTIAVVAWCFDAGRRTARRGLTVIGCLGVLGLISSALAALLTPEQAMAWYPAAWSAVALLVVPSSARVARHQNDVLASEFVSPAELVRAMRVAAVLQPVQIIGRGVLCATAVGSLLMISTPARVAAAIALVGLWLSVSRGPGQSLLWELLNWQGLVLLLQLSGAAHGWLWQLPLSQWAAQSLVIAAYAAASRLVFELIACRGEPGHDRHAIHNALVQAVAGAALLGSLYRQPMQLAPLDVVLAAASFAALALATLVAACRQQSEELAWLAEVLVAASLGYFVAFGVIPLGSPYSMFAVLAAGLGAWSLGQAAARYRQTAVLARPLTQTGLCLPLATVALAVGRHVFYPATVWLGMNSLALLLSAAFYFWRGLERRDSRLLVAAAAILNVALALLWRELSWSDPQLFMVPLGASILLLVEMLKADIPDELHNPLRYAGALVILVSPTFHIVGGSWLHLFTLMVASVAIVLVSIGLRVRALMYTGTAFLVADVVALVVRGSVDRPNLLWFAGILVGGAVIGIAAFCENHREVLLQRVRVLSATIGQWE